MILKTRKALVESGDFELAELLMMLAKMKGLFGSEGEGGAGGGGNGGEPNLGQNPSFEGKNPQFATGMKSQDVPGQQLGERRSNVEGEGVQVPTEVKEDYRRAQGGQ